MPANDVQIISKQTAVPAHLPYTLSMNSQTIKSEWMMSRQGMTPIMLRQNRTDIAAPAATENKTERGIVRAGSVTSSPR